MSTENNDSQNNKETIQNDQIFTPRLCTLHYIDKKYGEIYLPTRTDKIKFNSSELGGASVENILNIEGLEIEKPADLFKAAELLADVEASLRLIDYSNISTLGDNDDYTYMYMRSVSVLITILQLAKDELDTHMNYLMNKPTTAA